MDEDPAASLMLNHGIPLIVVSRRLGHANASVTLNIYAHTTVDMQNEAAALMDDLITPVPVICKVAPPSSMAMVEFTSSAAKEVMSKLLKSKGSAVLSSNSVRTTVVP